MDCQQQILDPYNDISLEEFCKNDLINLLKKKRENDASMENDNHNLKILVEKLEKDLSEQSRKCHHLEQDRIFLRSNIKKASAHWLERKAKLSESDQNQVEENEKDTENSEIEQKLLRNVGEAHILITEEAIKWFSELKFKNEQLELSEMQRTELTKRVNDYEKLINDQEIVIHGLEHQLETYFNDNQQMSKQLADLHRLFRDIEASNENHVKAPESMEETDTSKEYLPTEEDFKDMKGSVSKTYIKLKELIYEKKSLVTEIERLQTLNVELQHRVSQQENRLVNVTDALQTTWLLVSHLKDEHAKIHTSESILRYELREKREILQKLRAELECSREQWKIIRQKNAETEEAWKTLRAELDERRKLAEIKGNQSLTPEEIEGAIGGKMPVENEFEPPIDLLVDMAIEYGVVDADDDESTTVVALISGEDVQPDRLKNLEEQCCHLYQKLMTSTARALNLASHLTTLHAHYANEEEEEDDDDDAQDDDIQNEDDIQNDDDEDYLEEGDENLYETELLSPDSGSYDTAYVSEAEGTDSNSGAPTNLPSPTVASNDNHLSIDGVDSEQQGNEFIEDNCDVLSRTLITFLPRKIEILRAENKKLEERLTQQQEEKMKIEKTYASTLEFECRQRKELEKQLGQLGKCVDELKLERNGKIEALEEELRKKVEEVKKEEEEEYVNLQEKFEQREELLRLTSEQMQLAQEKVTKGEEIEKKLQENVHKLSEELENMKIKIQQRICDHECSKANSYNGRVPTNTTTQEPLLRQAREEMCSSLATCCEIDNAHLKIMSKDILRIPFPLENGSTLHWSLKVYSEEITFSIIFDPSSRSQSLAKDARDEQSFQIQTSFSSRSDINVSRELLEPFVFFQSNDFIQGSLCPKTNGDYIVLLKNSTSTTQEVSFKTWKQVEPEDKSIS